MLDLLAITSPLVMWWPEGPLEMETSTSIGEIEFQPVFSSIHGVEELGTLAIRVCFWTAPGEFFRVLVPAIPVVTFLTPLASNLES